MSFLPVLLLGVLASPPKGQLAYLSGSVPGDYRVHVVDLVSSAVTPVGRGKRDGRPDWSVDGSHLAFSSQLGEGRAIYLSNLEGEPQPIDHAATINHFPRWSRESLQLAYVSGVGEEQRIAVYDVESGTETMWAGGQTGLTRPVWIHSRQILAMMEEGAGTAEGRETVMEETDASLEELILAIGIVPGPQGITTSLFLVTPTAAFPFPEGVMPSRGDYIEWAVEAEPKSRRIAFESNDGGDREIFLISRKGGFDLSNHRAADWNPVWSPDSRWIAFESFRDGPRAIYRVYRDTIRVLPVAVGADYDAWDPDWSPDSDWITYVSNETGDPEIFITEIEDGEPIRITNHDGPDLAPAWRPETDE